MFLLGLSPLADARLPKLMSESKLEFPEKALDRAMRGWVIIEYSIKENGLVANAKVLSNCASKGRLYCENAPNNIWDDSALTYINSMRFQPSSDDRRMGEVVSEKN